MNKITILVVDDHQVVRLGLQTLLNVKPDFEVVGQAATAEEAIARRRGAAAAPDSTDGLASTGPQRG